MSKGNSDKQGKLPLYLSIGLVSALVIAWILIPGVRDFFTEAWEVLTSGDEQRIKQWVAAFGPFGPIVLISAMVAQMFLLVIPTVLLMVVSILAYGPIWGSLITLVAVAAASSVGYLLGKLLGENALMRLIGKKTEEKLAGALEDYGFWAVFITRLNPFLSNDAISFVAGLLRMGYLKFMGATLLGISPLILIIAFLNQGSGPWKQILLWVSLGGFIGLGVYIWWDQKKRGKRN